MTQKLSYLLFFLLSTLNGLAQTDTIQYNNTGKEQFTSNYASINLNYSLIRTLSKSRFHEYFEDTYNSRFGQETYSVGFNLAGPIVIGTMSGYENGKQFDGHTGLHYQFTDNFEPTDTASYSFKAFHFNFALGKDILYFWNNIDLPFRIGIDGGMAFLKENKVRNRNPFLSLVAQSELRFILWKIVIASKLEIGYDITSKNWKPKKNGINDQLSFKNHYYSLQFSIGYNLFEPVKKRK